MAFCGEAQGAETCWAPVPQKGRAGRGPRRRGGGGQRRLRPTKPKPTDARLCPPLSLCPLSLICHPSLTTTAPPHPPTPPLSPPQSRTSTKGIRCIVTVECTEARPEGLTPTRYTTQKNRKNTPERLELMKYNKHLKRHTLHREVK